MGDLIHAFYLLLYVGRFLAEQWQRRQSREWPLAAAETVEGSIISRRFPCLVAITYSYRVMGETYTGSLDRRCMRKQSALDLIDRASEPGVEVRYHPEHPDRSYLPLPLGIGGFAFAFPVVALFVGIIGILVFGLIQDRYNDRHSSIPVDQWQTVEADPVFTAQLPGIPSLSAPVSDGPHYPGWQPWNRRWSVSRQHQYFQILVLPLPCHQPAEPYFRQIIAQIQKTQPNRYLYQQDRIQRQGRPGLDLRLTRPYTRTEVFVNNDAAYFLSTNAAVTRDLNQFFDSFHFLGDPPPCMTWSGGELTTPASL